jgi:hypothetical protein
MGGELGCFPPNVFEFGSELDKEQYIPLIKVALTLGPTNTWRTVSGTLRFSLFLIREIAGKVTVNS